MVRSIPWSRVEEKRVEYAKTGRSTCKRCDNRIENKALRIGLGWMFFGSDFLSHSYYHPECVNFERGGIESVADFEGSGDLTAADKKSLNALIKSSGGARAEQAKAKTVTKKAKAPSVTSSSSAAASTASKKTAGKKAPPAKAAKGASAGKATKAVAPAAKAGRKAKQQAAATLATTGRTTRSRSAASRKRPADSASEEASSSEEYEDESESDSTSVEAPPPKKKARRVARTDSAADGSASGSEDVAAVERAEEQFATLTIPKLKELLRANGQLVGGTKGELVARCADCSVHGTIPRCPKCFGGFLHWDASSRKYKCKGFMDDDQFHFCSAKFSPDEIERGTWNQEVEI